MKVYDHQHIRNVGVIGHGDSGKTSLVSAMLFDAKAVNRLGKVDEGTTVTDFDPEEIERKISLSSALCFAEWKKNKINLIDTPGYGNFIYDAKSCLQVVESALVLVCAVSGVEVQTEKGWSFCEEFALPRLVVINKLDRERASFQRALESLNGRFGRQVTPIQLPLGEEASFRGVIDLLSMKAFAYERDESGSFKEQEIPEEAREEAGAAREKLLEMIAETDDQLMEKYFESGGLEQEELLRGLAAGIRERKLFPVLCASAARNIGAQQVLDAVVGFSPSPAERPPLPAVDRDSGEKAEIAVGPEAPLAAYVFKTIADPYAGRITLFRVFGGRVSADSSYYNLSRETQERFGSLALIQGKNQEPVDEVVAGDLASVAKLKATQTGDTFRDKGQKAVVEPAKLPPPAISYAIEPKARGDEDKISNAVQRLIEEDPTLAWRRDPRTQEFLLSGMGQTHVEAAVSKLKKRFGVEVILHAAEGPLPETIKGKARGPGAAQEADRRPRAVRRLLDPLRAPRPAARTSSSPTTSSAGRSPATSSRRWRRACRRRD